MVVAMARCFNDHEKIAAGNPGLVGAINLPFGFNVCGSVRSEARSEWVL